MRVIFIPQVLFAGNERRRWRWRIAASVVLALLLHLSLFYGWGRLDRRLPAADILPETRARDLPLQFVTVDQNLIDEATKPEKPVAEGRVSREARAEKIDENLPKENPAGTDAAQFDAFKLGEISPTDDGAPGEQMQSELAQPEQMQSEPAQPEPAQAEPAQAASPPDAVEASEEMKSPPTETPPAPPVEKSASTIKPEDFAEINDLPPASADAEILLPRPPAPASPRAATAEELLLAQAARQPTSQPAQPVQPTPERRPVPTRRIGGGAPSGGKMRARPNSATLVGIQNIAVLRSRYGEYMDELLRRIQNAIYIQQQLSPMTFTRGTVIFTFTVNAAGRLDRINYLGAEPADLPQETGAARRVLTDVQNGKLLDPPTPEMLADPLFQKITVNFIFDNF
ncbi:hypothetical protein FACS1894139_03330 [Planctomycetales bacterium]|nr:hypothetical protein FACS1894107_11350 [Planctomycetales bacterium]GHT03325.1 hypothetical protein FACS1894139_03330 [Planctomycetales bacterium]